MCNFVCPNCKSGHHTGCDCGLSTLAYYQPVYKNGININSDLNTITYRITCLKCNKNFNVIKGFDNYRKITEIKKNN